MPENSATHVDASEVRASDNRGLRVPIGLARACHLAPTIAVTALATALAVGSGRDVAGWFAVAGAVLAGQLSVGWSNDAFDAERDRLSGRIAKPIVAQLVSAHTVRNAAIIAAIACIPLSFASGLAAGAVHIGAVGAAWVYNLWLKSTVFSWLPYVIGFGSLPAFVTLGLPGHPWPAWWAMPTGALLGLGAHLANVLPDISADLGRGVRGWPQRLGANRVRMLVPVPLLLATALLTVAPGPSLFAWLGLTAATGISFATLMLGRKQPNAPFITTIIIAGIDVLLLLARSVELTGS